MTVKPDFGGCFPFGTHVYREPCLDLEAVLADRPVDRPMTNAIGCNVKWEGQDAHWMPPEACDLV